MEGSFALTIQIVIAVCAGIFAQVLGAWLKLPSIVILLFFGMGIGRDGLGFLHPEDFGEGLEVLVSLAVAVILFEGGLSLELKQIGKVSGSLRNLITIGTLITFFGGGIAAHWLSEFPWNIAFLYASLVVVTGPTVVSPLLKQVSVDKRVATLLEGEGVLIDPLGAILAVVVFNAIINQATDSVDVGYQLAIVYQIILRLVVGSLIGFLGGWLMSLLQKKADFLSDDLKLLTALAFVWAIFGVSQTLVSESGLMATVVAGIVLKASDIPAERLLLRFKGQLTTLGVSVLFILLAADLSIASVFALGWGSIFTVFALMFLVRPLSIMVCTWNSGMNWRQKFFLAWVAPRGIVSASVASLFAILLEQNQINGGGSIKALVFLTIIMTVVIQGLSAGLLAKLLKITTDKAKGVMIIGCNPLGRILGKLIQSLGESVVLIDTDPEACEKAKQENLPVFQSSALDDEMLVKAGIESVGTLIALTSNGNVNLMTTQKALEEFAPPKILAIYPQTEDTNININGKKINQPFISSLSVKKWNQYLREKHYRLGKTTIKSEILEQQKKHLENLIDNGQFLPLIVKREDQLEIINVDTPWQPEDQLIYLYHDPRSPLLKQLSGNKLSSSLNLETISNVEEIVISSSEEKIKFNAQQQTSSLEEKTV